jgi:hypothetical protein
MTKTITSIFSILFVLFISACSKSPANKPVTPSNSNLLIGKWEYKSDEVKIYTKGQQTGGGPYTYKNGEYIQFNADGTGRNEVTTFTYKIVNETLTVNYNRYSVGGQSYDAESEDSHIDELSDHKLTLFYDSTAKDSNGLKKGDTVVEYLTR